MLSLLHETNSPLNESNEKLRMKQWCLYFHSSFPKKIEIMQSKQRYEPVTKGRDLKWDTLPQNQTPSKLFSVLPLESSMFQVTISIIKKWF